MLKNFLREFFLKMQLDCSIFTHSNIYTITYIVWDNNHIKNVWAIRNVNSKCRNFLPKFLSWAEFSAPSEKILQNLWLYMCTHFLQNLRKISAKFLIYMGTHFLQTFCRKFVQISSLVQKLSSHPKKYWNICNYVC